MNNHDAFHHNDDQPQGTDPLGPIVISGDTYHSIAELADCTNSVRAMYLRAGKGSFGGNRQEFSSADLGVSVLYFIIFVAEICANQADERVTMTHVIEDGRDRDQVARELVPLISASMLQETTLVEFRLRTIPSPLGTSTYPNVFYGLYPVGADRQSAAENLAQLLSVPLSARTVRAQVEARFITVAPSLIHDTVNGQDELPGALSRNPNRIYFGRGTGSNHHLPNIVYRQVVALFVFSYMAASGDHAKKIIVQTIVKVLNALGLCFLKEHESGSWVEPSAKDVENKIAQKARDFKQAIEKGETNLAPELVLVLDKSGQDELVLPHADAQTEMVQHVNEEMDQAADNNVPPANDAADAPIEINHGNELLAENRQVNDDVPMDQVAEHNIMLNPANVAVGAPIEFNPVHELPEDQGGYVPDMLLLDFLDDDFDNMDLGDPMGF